MALPNCACTRNLLWICCLKPLPHSAAVFGTSRRRHALCFRHGNWNEYTLLDSGVKGSALSIVEGDHLSQRPMLAYLVRVQENQSLRVGYHDRSELKRGAC